MNMVSRMTQDTKILPLTRPAKLVQSESKNKDADMVPRGRLASMAAEVRITKKSPKRDRTGRSHGVRGTSNPPADSIVGKMAAKRSEHRQSTRGQCDRVPEVNATKQRATCTREPV